MGSTPTFFRHLYPRYVPCTADGMAQKLNTGDAFPRLTLNLSDGSPLELPDGIEAKYKVILFYRGHW